VIEFGAETLGKRPLWRLKKQDNIQMNVRQIGCEYRRLMELAQNRIPSRSFGNSGVETSLLFSQC
jgi:hypothetical protein